MTIKNMLLPYPQNVLEPVISEETFKYHYGKHYMTYINKLNLLIENTKFNNLSISEIIKKSSGNIFNNAAQVWNHEFYWKSISNLDLSQEKKNFFF